MGVVGKVISKPFKSVGELIFGKRTDAPQMPVPAQPAPPANDSGQKDPLEYNEAKRRRRGKKSLLVNSNTPNNPNSGGGTGLNI